MKKLSFLSLFTLCFLIGFSQTKKPDKTKEHITPKNTSTPLVQEILWPSSSNDTVKRTSVVVRRRPAIVTKFKL